MFVNGSVVERFIQRNTYLYMTYPATSPAIRPTTTGRGMLVAGVEKETPATKTTASRPSRRTVTKGRTNMKFFSPQILKSTQLVYHLRFLVDSVGSKCFR